MTKTQTLWDIGSDLEALKALMDECNAELSPDIDAALAEWFRELAQNESHKLDRYAGLMRQIETEAAALSAEAEQYEAKAKSRRNELTRLKDRVLTYIQASGRTKIQTASGRTFSVQSNGGKPPLRFVDAIDPATVPDHLVVVRRTLDNEAIRKALLDGDPDAKRIAMIDVLGVHLRLR